jgi:hypothetical protein
MDILIKDDEVRRLLSRKVHERITNMAPRFHRRTLLRSVMIAAMTIKSKINTSSNVGSDGAGLRATYGSEFI